MEKIRECEPFGGDDMSDFIAVLDYNVVEVVDSIGGGWVPSLGSLIYFVAFLSLSITLT